MVYLVGSPSHKNLAACVSVVLTQCLTEIRHAERATITIPEEEQQGPLHSHPRTQAERQTQQARQPERNARYEHIAALSKQGMKSSDIAVHVGMPERTIRQWLSERGVPYSHPQRQRPRLIDPYKTYLLSRWHQGCHNGSQLERELRAKGYKGSARAVYRYLETLEPSDLSVRNRRSAFALGQNTSPREPHLLLTLSAQQATWLFFRKREDLKEEERTYLRLLRQASPSAEATYQLVETFLHMVRERTGEQLDAWLGAVQASHLKAFQSFVTGVQQDKEAVLAGLTLPWSNGPLEGNVNRLKLIKRSMYGRTEFDLLKFRVLYQSKKNRDRKDKKKKQAQQVISLKKTKSMKSDTNSQRTTTRISKVA